VLIVLVVVDFPLCPTRAAVGVPCPGCGLTRASLAALQGDLGAAMAFHPLMPIITPMVGWMVGRLVLVNAGVVRSDSFDPLGKLPRWFWWGFMVVLVGVWGARLAGALGGLPDPVDPSTGFVMRGVSLVSENW
jgi:hypothetical protein